MGITIVGMGYGGAQDLTQAAYKVICGAGRLYVQTARHPVAKYLENNGIAFHSLDKLYENAADFDELNQRIIQEISGQDCVLGVLGDGVTGNAVVERLLAQGLADRIVPGVSLQAASAALRSCYGGCVMVPAAAFAQTVPGEQPMAFFELDRPLLAAEIKLHLQEYYPDETEVTLVSLGAGDFSVRDLPLFELDWQKDWDAFTCLLVPALDFAALRRFGFGQLADIMVRLRGPGGCPWDREQTHESLKQNLLEECYEVFEAIDEQDDDKLCEELGDVLLQVVFHGMIAQEQGRFSLRDIITGLCEKLIRRHPHIFGHAYAPTPDAVVNSWETIKKREKGFSCQSEVLKSVPVCLPSLMRSYKVQKKAANVGFDWEDPKDAFLKIEEETGELREARGEQVREELGDLLFAVVNVARILKIEPELALKDAIDKFIRRFEAMETLAMGAGKQLFDMRLEEMDGLWDAVKAAEKDE
ncbi:MAG: nucleoside triphosphate pyrophosphohydrolase [Christensenellales bacterium]|jgi:tetrapyrrole methylase family protein/MazG family protein